MTDRTEATPAGYVPPTDALADPLPPALTDGTRYTLVRKLGGGGMGVVYLLHNVRMGRPEVVKLIRPDGSGSAELSDRFRAEVRAAGQLSHPNVVTGYGTDEIDGTLVLAMEFVDGTDLAEMVKRDGPLPVGQACEYARQAALGLQHAHDRGLVHRDVKPHNLLLKRDGGQEWVKVIDFGLVKAEALDHLREERTQAEQLLGSPPYMAPEQWAGASAVGPPADIYALGCVLYHLLAGRPPFAHCKDRHQLMLAHVADEPPPIPDLPTGLASVLGRMLAKEPAARPPSAGEAAALLAPFTGSGYHAPATGRPIDWADEASTGTYRPPPPVRDEGSSTEALPEPEPVPTGGGLRWVGYAGGAAVVVAAAWLTVWAMGDRPADGETPQAVAKRPDAPAATAPDPPKPVEAKPLEPKPAEPKPAEPKPAEPKPAEPKPAEPKPAEPKPASKSRRPVRSDFGRNDADGWTTVNFRTQPGATRPIGFDHSGGQWWLTANRVGTDPFLWSAPDKFLGDQSDRFGKWLVFYTLTRQPMPADVLDGWFVILRGAGGQLAVAGKDMRLRKNQFGWTVCAVRLNESGKWQRSARPKFPNQPATDDDIKTALGGIRTLLIRGEFENHPGGVIDMIELGADEVPK